MTEIFAVTLLIVLILLADSYLRFLPFSARLDDEIKRRLRRRQLVCSIVAVPIIANIFLVNGIIAASFKAVLMLGWIPYVLIQVLTVKGKTLQHIYIVGMFGLWCLLQHNWASILDVVFWLDRPESVILIIHSIEYLILFVVLLPLERRCFLTLLPADAFFENRPQSYYIAVMPFVFGFGHLLLWADERLLHSWGERLSRLYLLPVFLFLWRYILAGAQRFFEHRRTMRESRMMEEQLSALERHNRAMRDNQRQMEELQKNLRAEYEMIARRLRSGDLDGVREHISRQDALIDSTKIIEFCRAPLINAAISIYIQQAERHRIKCRHKINLPPTLPIDENDFSILLSNVLENAVNASRKQPEGRRELSIIIQTQGKQCVVEIANRFDGAIEFDENDLPITSVEGHGIGTTSVMAFAKKYGAHAAFDQSDGWVTFSMYLFVKSHGGVSDRCLQQYFFQSTSS